jgi:hypothetical protein
VFSGIQTEADAHLCVSIGDNMRENILKPLAICISDGLREIRWQFAESIA